MVIPPVNYSAIRNSLQTGDIFTFTGTSALDYMIQLMEGQPYNHVGMVIRQGANLYFWDAPGGGNQFPDPYKNNQPHSGCRVAPLDQLLSYYMQKEVSLYYRQMQPALNQQQLDALQIFVNLVDGFPFPGGELNWPDQFGLGAGIAGSYFIGKKFSATIAGSYFCAHLIADTYMHMGLLPTAPLPPNGYSPADFDGSGSELPLIGVALTPVVPVNFDLATQAAPAATSA